MTKDSIGLNYKLTFFQRRTNPEWHKSPKRFLRLTTRQLLVEKTRLKRRGNAQQTHSENKNLFLLEKRKKVQEKTAESISKIRKAELIFHPAVSVFRKVETWRHHRI